jgi:hypothetical protein
MDKYNKHRFRLISPIVGNKLYSSSSFKHVTKKCFDELKNNIQFGGKKYTKFAILDIDNYTTYKFNVIQHNKVHNHNLPLNGSIFNSKNNLIGGNNDNNNLIDKLNNLENRIIKLENNINISGKTTNKSINDNINNKSINDNINNKSINDNINNKLINDNINNKSINDNINNKSINDKNNDKTINDKNNDKITNTVIMSDQLYMS